MQTKKKILELYQNSALPLKEIAKCCDLSEKSVYNVAKAHHLTKK